MAFVVLSRLAHTAYSVRTPFASEKQCDLPAPNFVDIFGGRAISWTRSTALDLNIFAP